MFQNVSIKKIKNIKERLESELEDKDLPFQRKKEVKSIIKLYTQLEKRKLIEVNQGLNKKN